MIKGEVTGEVVFSETAPTGKQHVFVVKEQNGRWENFLACKGYGKTLELAQTVRVGDTVKVAGYVASRAWENAGATKWFTDFNIQQLTVLGKSAGKHRDVRDQDIEDSDPDRSEWR